MMSIFLFDAFFALSFLLLATAVVLIFRWLRKGDLSAKDLLIISALTLSSIALIRLTVDPIECDFVTRLMNCILRSMQTIALEENMGDIVDELHTAVAAMLRVPVPETLTGSAAQEFLRSAGASTFRGTLYAAFASVQYVLAPVICGLALVEVVANLVGGLRERFCRKPVYVFSQLNRESLTLAESIARTQQRVLICFFGAAQKQQEEFRSRLRQIDAIVHEDEIRHKLFPRFAPCTTCLVCSGSEEDNLNTLSRLLEEGEEDGFGRLKYFVFAHSSQAERLTDKLAAQYVTGADCKDGQSVRLVCMINPEENLVSHILARHPLHACTAPAGEKRRLNVLILGSGHLAEHMLRNVFACGQMIGCTLSITAAAQNEKAFRTRMEASVPMLRKPDDPLMQELGTIAFEHLECPAAADSLPSAQNADYMLCALDNDADNIQAAGQLRVLIDQQKLQAAAHQAPRASQQVSILYVVKDPSMNALCLREEAPAYDVRAYTPCTASPVGSNSEQYSADVIFSNEIMHQGFFVDRSYNSKLDSYDGGRQPESMMNDFFSFMNSAYGRRSSIANAQHIPYRSSVLAEAKDEDKEKTVQLLAKVEHQRWCAYTIMDGFTRPTDEQLKGFLFRGNSNTKETELLLHPCLVPSKAVPLGDPFAKGAKAQDCLDEVSLKIHDLILPRVKALFEANGLDAAMLMRTKAQSPKAHKEDLLKEAGKLPGSTQKLAEAMIKKLYNNFRSSDIAIVQDTARIRDAAEKHRQTLENFWQHTN